MKKSLESMVPFEDGMLRVVVETPRGSRGKFTYDEGLGVFRLTGILSEGMHFPFDFGFIPSTRGEDGDPLDVLVLCDVPVPTGCVLDTRLIGCLTAVQKEKGKTERNDRFLAVEVNSLRWKEIQNPGDLPKAVLERLEFFLMAYNKAKGKEFKIKGRKDAKTASVTLKKFLTKSA
jgi:inorganic pyrophosphatase